MPTEDDDEPTGTDSGGGPQGPGRQFFVPAPGGTPDPPPSSTPPGLGAGVGPPPGPRQPPVARPPAAPSAPPPPAAPVPAPRPSRRRVRPRLRWFVVYLPLLLIAVATVLGIRAFWSYRAIERVDLSGVLDPVTGDTVNYLLVGSDSREGFDPDVTEGGTSTVTGKRSDTIILLRVGPSGSMMMSIPRDLWVTVAGSGEKGRINGAYNEGPANLVRTVQDNLDVPVNHYMEVGFGSFAGVVDALGGVTVTVPHPAFDVKSGLVIEQAGDVTLDGRQSLAYVRSRTYTEVIDGKPVTDPTADLGRAERQQQFLRTTLADVGSTRNPIALVRVSGALSEGLIIDDDLGMLDLFGLVRKLGGSSPETVVLPTVGARKGGASVLVLAEPEAQATLARFR